MHTLNPNVLKNQIRQIEPYCVTNRLEIDSWKSYTGMHVSPNNIVLDENPPIQMYLGDRWKVGYDETRYFESEITVPAEFEGKKVYLSIDFGGEAIVRINGQIVGAVSSEENFGWVHRTEILFKDGVKAGEKLNIQVEGAVNCAGFCDRAIAGAKYMEYTLNKAELIAVDRLTESYWFDISPAWDTYAHCEEEYVKSRRLSLPFLRRSMFFGARLKKSTTPPPVKSLWQVTATLTLRGSGRLGRLQERRQEHSRTILHLWTTIPTSSSLRVRRFSMIL